VQADKMTAGGEFAISSKARGMNIHPPFLV